MINSITVDEHLTNTFPQNKENFAFNNTLHSNWNRNRQEILFSLHLLH